MSMTKAEYLKRYMSDAQPEASDVKKKKRRKKTINAVKHSGFKVVDEDLDFKSLPSENLKAEDEEAPTVAEVIDERPEEVRRMEEYKDSNKWKSVAKDFDESVNLQLDQSPPRRHQRYDADSSPPRRQRHDSDISPPRRQRHDSDNSPPRRQRHDSDNSPPRRQRHDSDNSPPRRQRHDSDQSPPRRMRQTSDHSPARKPFTHADQSPNSNEKGLPKKTLSGKAAGLSSAKDMRAEAEKLKQREAEMFSKIGDDKLGKNATTVFRNKATGKKRDVQGEKEADSAKKAEMKEKYDKWSKGLAQGAAEQHKVNEMVHEMNKPLARAKDDADLDAYLKDQDREGDPMLNFLKKKKEAKSKAPKYPVYKGPAPDPNRFSIRPGYRWDGVDRSNGFEKKYFQSISHRKAVASDAYKWSTEDM